MKSEFAFQYTVVGDGDLKSALVSLSVELGIADRVTFTGRVDEEDLKSYYRQADLFVMPSGIIDKSFEGFGIVYLEANAMGVPTMAVRAGGAQEAVKEGKSGIIFVKDATVDDIENGLRSFLNASRTFCPEECRQFAAEFTWERVIGRFEEAYNSQLKVTKRGCMPVTSVSPRPRARRSTAAALAQAVGAGRVRGQERLVGGAAFEQVAVDGEGHHDVGAGTERQVDVGLAGHVRGARIDHDD